MDKNLQTTHVVVAVGPRVKQEAGHGDENTKRIYTKKKEHFRYRSVDVVSFLNNALLLLIRVLYTYTSL